MKILLFVFLGFLSACASNPNEVDLDLGPSSLNDIRQAIFAVIGSPRTTSENQRDFQSEYFPRIPDAKFDANAAKTRLYSKVIILGDSRPYTLQVQTFVEAKTREGFQEIGEDRGFTDEIANSIQKRLNQSLNHRNIIDEFRAF